MYKKKAITLKKCTHEIPHIAERWSTLKTLHWLQKSAVNSLSTNGFRITSDVNAEFENSLLKNSVSRFS